MAANSGPRAAAGPGETRVSYWHAATATSPSVANRNADFGCATGSRGNGSGNMAPTVLVGKLASGCSSALFPDAEAREHAIQNLVRRHHPDQVVEHSDGGA